VRELKRHPDLKREVKVMRRVKAGDKKKLRHRKGRHRGRKTEGK
jgi:hypothetical protein